MPSPSSTTSLLARTRRQPSHRLAARGASPLSVDLTAGGDVAAIRLGDGLLVSQHTADLHRAAVGGLHLRRQDPDTGDIGHAPLTGALAGSLTAVGPDSATYAGTTLGARWTVTLQLLPGDPIWVWRVDLAPVDPSSTARYDVVLAQDLSLAPEAAAQSSEAYVSQYVAHHVTPHPDHGALLLSRQTMASPGLPLALTAIAEGARGWLTDGMQVHGTSARAGAPFSALADAEWDNAVLQFEHTMATLRSGWFTLDGPRSLHLVGAADPERHGPLADHTAWAESAIAAAVRHASSPAVGTPVAPSPPSLLMSAPAFDAAAASDDDILLLAHGSPRLVERSDCGAFLSGFDSVGAHLVAGEKELLSERPHGHILKAGTAIEPGEDIVSATVFGHGVFASHLVIGNTSYHRALSVHRHHLDVHRAAGLRVLVSRPGTDAWQILQTPTAMRIDLGTVRWLYRNDDAIVTVDTTADDDGAIVIDVHTAPALDVLVTMDIELGEDPVAEVSDRRTVTLRPTGPSDPPGRPEGLTYALVGDHGIVGDDARLFPDSAPRGTSVLTWGVRGRTSMRLAVGASLDGEHHAISRAVHGLEADRSQMAEAHRAVYRGLVKELEVPADSRLSELATLAPWYAHNALIHFLVPHGLEQYSGAAWGTRDVTQGPFELMLVAGRPDISREILLLTLARQRADGTFPQWFMRGTYSEIMQEECHGDVPVWPLFALAQYLDETHDHAILDATVRSAIDGSESRVADCAARIVDHLESIGVAGTSLPAYGHGDWDDTLQPAQESWRARLSSTWTSALAFQALALGGTAIPEGAHAPLRDRMRTLGARLRSDVLELMVRDGVLAGYLLFDGDETRPLIHPSDGITGISHRLIPMNRGIISGLLPGELARAHEQLVERVLHYPDGVRLMSSPARFADGEPEVFLRGEQAAAVGREIGLMYTHAHIRWVEALAALGRARTAEELLRISPIGVGDRLRHAAPRQRNAYHSSSDADFPDRYEAARRWDELRTGDVAVRGGWRIYSSGPGIFLRQLVHRVLGIQERGDTLRVDPVLSPEDDGLEIRIEIAGRARTVRYRLDDTVPRGITVDGAALTATEVTGTYRIAGIEVSLSDVGDAEVLEVICPAGT